MPSLAPITSRIAARAPRLAEAARPSARKARHAPRPRGLRPHEAVVGMHSYLRGLEMWRNLPTDEPPKLSQLWHRDWDDVVNLKLFVYLSDVTEESGPFTFAPGTQPGGPRQLDVQDRLSDDEMAARVRREDWVVCTGGPGTGVLADTCGYHKGGEPTQGDRPRCTAQFT